MSEYDTRPTIETVLEETRKGFAAVALDFAALRGDLSEIKSEMKIMREDLRQIARLVINQNERWDRLEERVDRLERK